MTAAVESFAYNTQNGVPWHGLGESVEGTMTWEEAIEKAGLDWRVELAPHHIHDGTDEAGQPIYRVNPDSFAVVRDSDRSILGTVGKAYTPVQNVDAFRFLDSLSEVGMVEFETAGSLLGGRLIFGLAYSLREVDLGDGDKTRMYMLMGNRHDGKQGLIIKLTGVRVVCWNTFQMALGMEGEQWTRRHVGLDGAAGLAKVQEAAQDVLGIVHRKIDYFEQTAQLLRDTPSSDELIDAFMDSLFPMPKQQGNKKPRTGKAQANRDRYLDALTNAPGQNLTTASGSMWGVVNAATAFELHHQTVRPQVDETHEGARARRVLFGAGTKGTPLSFSEYATNTALSLVS